MFSRPRKITILLLLALALLLCACSPDISQNPSGNFGGNNFMPTGESVTSSIFGRNVKYDRWSPAEGITLPVDSSEILDMIQIKKVMYFFTADGIYSLDIESGEGGKLIDTAADMFASHGETLYTYSNENGRLCAYSVSGELVSESNLVVETQDLDVEEFFVTDDYYAFVCIDQSEYPPQIKYYAYDKESLELANTFNGERLTGNHEGIYSLYKGNSVLKAKDSLGDARYCEISEINFEKGKTTMLTEFNSVGYFSEYDITYNPETDTVIVFVAPRDFDNSYPLYISEHSLSDPDNIVHQRFYVDVIEGAKPFVGIYENIISAIYTADNEVRYFNYLNPPESITLACTHATDYKEIISGFEKETGILVRTVNYGFDFQRLDIKLMAGDTDFDLFEPIYMHQHKYFIAGMYEDLSQYEGLKQRLDGDLAASFISKLGDTYVGIPTGIGNSFTRDTFDEDGGMNPYSKQMSRLIYLADNIDVTTGTFNDSEGDELYKLLKYYYDYPTGNIDKMPFGNGDDYLILNNGFIAMNPSGTNKENTVKFLEYMFDVLNGDIKGIVPENSHYMNLDSTDDVYIYWHLFAWNYVEPIFNATNTISQCDGKNSTIKDIAREAAQEVRMRMME
ncbi:MAG: hypothetical protein IJ424_03305 [Oscillospiraceae bacterium]|nr:hypothetical protein [Oscillospiraceae bacterium]